MKNKLPFGMLLCGLILMVNSCETDDIEPKITVTLSTNQLNVSEAEGTTNIVASLNIASTETVTIDLFAAGTATNGIDYTLSASSLSIPAGSLSASILFTAIQDTLKEGSESANINISSASGASIGAAKQISITIDDDDVAPVAQLIFNEVLYDPSNSSLDGDANGDGVYNQEHDAFVEIYNASSADFDISNYEIWDDTVAGSAVYIIPNGTIIPSQKVLVIFGGGTPTGSFGGSTVLVSNNGDDGLSLRNSDEIIGLKDPNGKVVLSFNSDSLSNNPNESYTRNPDITGEFEQHNANTPLLFSPGTKIDGTSF